MTTPSWPWPAGAATGVGSLPGTDIVDAVALVLGELPDLPHLPELPARGPGADLIGRGAGLLTDLPVELHVGRWRVASRPGRDARRTGDLFERDVDTFTEAAQSYAGPVKVQACGPWTLAAGIDLAIGGRVLHDHGATRDLAASLAEGLREHVAEVSRRMPAATVLLQLDEPSLPAVLAGQIPSESGLHTLRAVAPAVAESALRRIVDAVGVPVIVHCCGPDVPLELLKRAGVAAVSLDLSLIDSGAAGLDRLGGLIDAGVGLFAGAVPSLGPAPASRAAASTAAADRVTQLWQRLGFALAGLPAQVVVTPACGLAGATREGALATLGVAAEAGRRLAEHLS